MTNERDLLIKSLGSRGGKFATAKSKPLVLLSRSTANKRQRRRSPPAALPCSFEVILGSVLMALVDRPSIITLARNHASFSWFHASSETSADSSSKSKSLTQISERQIWSCRQEPLPLFDADSQNNRRLGTENAPRNRPISLAPRRIRTETFGAKALCLAK